MARVIAIGASAGGVGVLKLIAAGLPAGLQAAVLVVLHIGRRPSLLPEILASSGALPARHAQHQEALRPGCIYVAPPDSHLLVQGDHLELLHGPKEHHARPAIDPLFRSAAVSHGSGVVGVVLSGMLDDGTAGLQAIKQCGGMAVVQDPDDAQEPSMPKSALQHVAVDHCAAGHELAALLARLTESAAVPAAAASPPCETAMHELSVLRGRPDALACLRHIGTPSTYACPECHGALWRMNGSLPARFRCHTGHAFSARTLEHALGDAGDDALWQALRALQEHRLMLLDLADERRHQRELQEAGRLEQAAHHLALNTAALWHMLRHGAPAERPP